MKTITITTLAAITLAAATTFSVPDAHAQVIEKTGKVVLTPSNQVKNYGFCTNPRTRYIGICSIADEKKQQLELRQQREMDAEARAYKKMQEDRQRRQPTIEHCFMKGGKLECKPA